ncbi:TPA: hypothetical protein RP427_003746, partial [Acinetobacter baumannii]|nr:hypothetical protein [Acinetobacter baumannii]
ELKNKIKLVGFWTFGGVFWYLVISFFLLSEYPIQDFIFDHKKAYDVLKDALTIAASFLAPVAAFVLFTDWREQHKLVKLEKDAEQFIHNIYIANKTLLTFFNSICVGEKKQMSTYLKVFELRNDIYLQTNMLFNDIKRVNLHDLNVQMFCIEAAKSLIKIRECATEMFEVQEKYDADDLSYLIDIKKISNTLDELVVNQEKLSEISVDLKI